MVYLKFNTYASIFKQQSSHNSSTYSCCSTSDQKYLIINIICHDTNHFIFTTINFYISFLITLAKCHSTHASTNNEFIKLISVGRDKDLIQISCMKYYRHTVFVLARYLYWRENVIECVTSFDLSCNWFQLFDQWRFHWSLILLCRKH